MHLPNKCQFLLQSPWFSYEITLQNHRVQLSADTELLVMGHLHLPLELVTHIILFAMASFAKSSFQVSPMVKPLPLQTKTSFPVYLRIGRET